MEFGKTDLIVSGLLMSVTKMSIAIANYETKFISGVLETYEMLKELDEVQNDAEFWKVFGNIKAGFHELDDAVKNYYAELRKYGGDTKNCSLAYELNYGIYDLDDKYWAIRDKIAEIPS
jgi:hypothetical protein